MNSSSGTLDLESFLNTAGVSYKYRSVKKKGTLLQHDRCGNQILLRMIQSWILESNMVRVPMHIPLGLCSGGSRTISLLGPDA